MNPTTTDIPTRSKTQLAAGLVVSVVICLSAAGIGGWMTAASVDSWYAEINKPSWNPPNWIFAPVWTTLYVMMAIAAWWVWKQSKLEHAKAAFGWFFAQLLLNVLWSGLFFGLRQPGWAFAEIIVLWIAIAATIVTFWRHSRFAAGLLVPYLMWVTFASVLNYSIWSMNLPS